ncbi:MAG: ATP-binding cassette domain-containing protein [Sandaracinus sp.]|nr:ATP-binding cassette domain-containing protein [Sandaracinus sp.]
MIEARDLTKQYGPATALKDVSFEVRKGEVLGFLGPNGAGKTTTMKILTCFIAPTTGSAKVNGADIFEDPMAVRKSIGYLPESTPLYTEMLVLEYLEFAAKMRGFKGEEARKRIKKAVEQTSLGDVIAKEIRALSKGFRQRVGLAQALVHEPPVLILDEPMSGLDPNQAAEIRDLIRDIGRERTVILSTHDLGEVQVTCDRVLIIAKGRLVADDTPEELRDRAGKASYQITLKEDADKRGEHSSFAAYAQSVLSKLPSVASARLRDAEAKGEVIFAVTPKDSADLRSELFQFAVKNELTLLGLEKKSEGLDKVFRDLTTGDTSGAVASTKSKRDQKIEEARDKKKARDAAKGAEGDA